VVSGGGTAVGCDGEERKRRRGCTVLWRSEGEEGKNDLKEGHVRAKNACDRTYISAFDRILAKGVCVKWALCSNVQGTFERMRAKMCV
jgi:hypothetical protein